MLGYIYIRDEEQLVGVAIPYSEWEMQHLCQQIWTYSEQNKALGARSAWPLCGVMASRSYSTRQQWSSLLHVVDPHSLRIQAQISCIGLLMYKWPPVNPRGNFCGEVLNKGSSSVWQSQKNPPSSWADWLGRFLGLLTEVELDASILSQKG